ncbi:hypothetical protein [Bacillus sp. REN3]|uniref:hypothetical protein n=1 Tax=Bacillus sp. REN3 TaxID=2802440 RepID=UPI001AEF08F7|nr:hypothetical protein [Bacillus sp. REN3]
MSQIKDEYVGTCTNCGKEIRSNDYWESFDGMGCMIYFALVHVMMSTERNTQ